MKRIIFLFVFVFSVINMNAVSFAEEYPDSIVELNLGSDRVIYNINGKKYSARYYGDAISLRYVLNAIGIGDENIAWNETEKIVEISKNIVYHTDEELEEKYRLLSDNWDELYEKSGKTGFAVNGIYNTADVYAYEWSEDAKEYMINFLGTDNIHFGIDNGVDIND